MSLLLVAGQTLVIYVFLVVVLSRAGRSLMAGINHFDYLIVALLGSAVETGLYRGSNSLWAGVVSAATLILANWAASSLLCRWPLLRRLLVGGPLVVVHDGRLLRDQMRQAHMSEDDVRLALRRLGYDKLDQVHVAVMGPNGEIGVVPVPGVAPR